MAKTNKTADLLKVLGQKAPSHEAPHPEPQRPARVPASRAPKPKLRIPAGTKVIRGRGIQFFLHEQDEKLIREFAVWLAPHRKRINDSLVIKTVLRAAKTGPALLEAYDDAIKIDGRTKKTPQ